MSVDFRKDEMMNKLITKSMPKFKCKYAKNEGEWRFHASGQYVEVFRKVWPKV